MFQPSETHVFHTRLLTNEEGALRIYREHYRGNEKFTPSSISGVFSIPAPLVLYGCHGRYPKPIMKFITRYYGCGDPLCGGHIEEHAPKWFEKIISTAIQKDIQRLLSGDITYLEAWMILPNRQDYRAYEEQYDRDTAEQYWNNRPVFFGEEGAIRCHTRDSAADLIKVWAKRA